MGIHFLLTENDNTHVYFQQTVYISSSFLLGVSIYSFGKFCGVLTLCHVFIP